MNRKKDKSRYWLLPTIFFILILIFDIGGLLHLFQPIQQLRDLFFILAMLALLPVMQKFHQNIGIYDKVRLFAGAVFLVLGMNILFRAPNVQNQSMPAFLFHAIISWLTFIGMLLAITALRDLIFVHRKKSTSRNFYLLLLSMVMFGVFTRQDFSGFTLNMASSATSLPADQKWIRAFSFLLSIAMVYLIVLNSFRVQWVKVLNKQQKFKTFLFSAVNFGLIIFILFAMSEAESGKLDALYRYSSFIGNLTWACLLFVFVYLFFSIILVLLYLPTAGVYDRKVKEILSLHQLSSIILGVFDIEQLSQIILKRTIEVTGANYGWLLLKRPESNDYDLVGQRNVPASLLNYLTTITSNDLTDWIISRKAALAIDQISKHRLTSQLDYWKRISGSLLGIPLVSSDRVCGLLFAVKNVEFGFLPDDKMVMSAFANNITIAIENANLVRKTLEQEKYEQELKIAHKAQMKLLPRAMPSYKRIDIAASCMTANEIGGDYYGFFEFDKTKFGIVIGDVSGKGPEAAFYMAEVKGVLEALSHIYQSPCELLIHANRILYENFDSKTFISVIYGIFNLSQMRFQFCRAGHCPLLYWSDREQQAHLLEPPGLALGLESGKRFEKSLLEQRIELNHHDILIFYTDGVSEARNNRQEEFDEHRILDIVAASHECSALELKKKLLEQIEDFVGDQPRHDDLTMVVFKIR